MDILFIHLLNMSIRAGWLILTVIVVRALFKKMPKWARCILWGLVAVRLICPYAYESKLSLVPDTRVFSSYNDTTTDSTDAFIGTAMLDKYYSAEDGVVSSLNKDNIKKDNSIKYAVTKSIVSIINKNIIFPHNALFFAEIAWIAGMFILIINALINYLKLKKSIEEAVPLNSFTNIAGNTNDVMVADAVKTPFILGIVRPKIYIPSDTDESGIKYILAHEMLHLRRKDHLWKLTGYAILTVYCFDPLIWLGFALFCKDLELACDEGVINKYDDGEKKSYSETLLLCSMQKKSVLSCPLAFGEIAVKERIKAVINHKKTKKSIIIVSLIICTVLAACFLTNPVRSSAKDMDGTWAVESKDTAVLHSEEFLKEYAKFGITCDKKTGNIKYKGKNVKFLYDGSKLPDIDNLFKGGISFLHTYRDENGSECIYTVREKSENGLGRLTGIKEFTKEEMEKIDLKYFSEEGEITEAMGVDTAVEGSDVIEETDATDVAISVLSSDVMEEVEATDAVIAVESSDVTEEVEATGVAFAVEGAGKTTHETVKTK